MGYYMKKRAESIIIKGIDGFYYVKVNESIYECRARGLFRKMGMKPLAGDKVMISLAHDKAGLIEEILPRKNFFVRPPIANIDVLLIVSSVCDPLPSMYNIDKLTVIAKLNHAQPVIVFTKTDLKDSAEYKAIYESAGFPVVAVSCRTGEGIETLRSLAGRGLTVLAGNSGVGKSSIINLLVPDANAMVGEISRKHRGRHTTRECTLYPYGDGYITDTAGFSSLDLLLYKEKLTLNDLQYYYPEFSPYLGKCKFSSCSHTVEKGCEILSALQFGKISRSRHENYCRMYRELSEVNHY